MVLNQIIPWDADYRHMEGNSLAHVKSTLVGASELVAIENGTLNLGTWQGIYLFEHRARAHRRRVLIRCLGV